MSSDIIENLNQLRLASTGCDVLFEVGAKSFPAHRVVLMARLEYFRNMLTADMRERRELVISLDPQIIDSLYFGEILNYIYISKIDFTNENIRAIYKAADYFCFDELTDKVKEHLKNTMRVENVVFYKTIAVDFGLETLEEDCQQFIIQNLPSDLNRAQLIPTLLFEDLKEILQKLKQMERIEEMFHYSIDWILHHKPNSADNLVELFKNIPLQSLSFQFLKQVVSQTDLIRKENECLNLLLETILSVAESFITEINELNTAITESDTRTTEVEELQTSIIDSIISKPRVDSLYAIGGLDEQWLSSVSEYNSKTGEWGFTIQMPGPRSHFSTAVIGHKIYLCGGYNGSCNLNQLTVFDTYNRLWAQLRPMKYARHNCASAVLNGQIYVAGGLNGTNRLTAVERYSVETDRWEEVSQMIYKRNALELVALNGFLYAIGGFNGTDALSTVERYDPQTDEWTLMNNMNNRYQAFGSAVLNGYIYIVGDETCEVYYPADDKWIQMPAPSICQNGRRLAVYDGELYVIGGRLGEQRNWKGIRTVEVFDMQARVWRQEPDMDTARCYHGVAVVRN